MGMSKTAFTEAHRILVQMLTKARHESNILQAELAEKLGKDQSFISNIERYQRRIDVIEFCDIADAIGIDKEEFFKEFLKKRADIA